MPIRAVDDAHLPALVVDAEVAIDRREEVARPADALDGVFTPDAHIDYSVFGGSVGNLEETMSTT